MNIQYETRAIKDLKAVDAKIRARIVSKIVQYAAAPEELANQIKHLTGSPFYRLRVGDYRVIFSLDGDTPVVLTVARVRHRREAYD